MYKPLIALSVVVLAPLSSAQVSITEVDPEKLWLPSIYQNHVDSMQQAANLAASETDCATFIKGNILQDKSTREAAFFRFICRDSDRQTFAILVDGQTFAVNNPLREVREARERALLKKQQKEDAALQEQKRLEEEAELARKLKEQKEYWPLCFDEMKKKLKLMRNLSITSRMPPIPVISMNETFTYSINFDATSVTDKPLQYRASCMISALDSLEVKVKPRRR